MTSHLQQRPDRSPAYSRSSPLPLLLLLALLHGLLYTFITPPWQHYDEPNHFEYARQIATLNHVPDLTERDLDATREIADSMYRFRFWSPGVQPDLIGPQPPEIGINQRIHPPLYYAIAAIPIRWVRYLSIETQLYAARMVSVLFYALTLLAAWRLGVVLTPDAPAFQTAFPLLVGLTPVFANIMSAVNSDVLVNFSITALLLSCVLLIRDGPRPAALLLVFLSLTVGLLTKRTAVVGVAPLLFALFWSVYRRPVRWQIWIAGTLTLALIASLTMLRVDLIATDAGVRYAIHPRPWLENLTATYLRVNIDATIQSLLDWERSRAYYPLVVGVSFTTFWTRFGWAHVSMAAPWEITMVGIVGAASIGAVIQAVRTFRRMALWQQRSLWIFALTLLMAWLAVVIRLHPLLPPGSRVFIPGGRYLLMTMIPTIWLVAWGFQGLFPRRWQPYALFGLALFFALLDANAWLVTLINFYYH